MEGNIDTTAHRLADRIARIAWFAAFVVPLILAVLLLGMRSAQATTPVAGPALPSSGALAFGEEEKEEEELGDEESEAEFAEEDCEIAKEEFDEGELSKAEVDEICSESTQGEPKSAGSSSAAGEECVLRSAHGHASTSGKDDKLKVTIGYTTYRPADAKLRIGHLATLHRHLGRSGVLRLVENLHGHAAPKRLSVRIDIPSASSAGCHSKRLLLFPR